MISTPNQAIIKQLQEELKIREKKEYDKAFLEKYGPELIELLNAEEKIKKGLPHLYGYPWYQWAYDFFESRNQLNFLCAANQISKSSTQIRKCIHWATEPGLWKELWPDSPNPNQFWYLYPTGNQCTIEYRTKWKQFLPAGEYKDHPQYGWKEEIKNKEIYAIHFNTGISVYFKSYKQGLDALQTGTVFAVFLDEECPENLWDELVFRTSASKGYIHMVFTATIGQEVWRQTIEPDSKAEEKFPQAWKKQVSMYECQQYMDGSPGPWSNERIAQVIATCKSEAEVQRRVYGRFVKDSGLKYPQFEIKKHVKQGHPIPKNWYTYVGVDIGSGGEENHPAAICFIGVSPDMRQGRVFAAWRGDGLRTTAGDVLKKVEEMCEELNVFPVLKVYDFASAEFGELAARNGGGWVKAEKSHELGERTINTLFKNNMLAIYEGPETSKLIGELVSLTISGAKNKKKDDLSDAFRYAVVKIPWDWSIITGKQIENVVPEQKFDLKASEIARRRGEMDPNDPDYSERRQKEELESEFSEWNELYGA